MNGGKKKSASVGLQASSYGVKASRLRENTKPRGSISPLSAERLRKIEGEEITHEEIFVFNLCLVPERNDCAGPVDSCAESATEFRRRRNRSWTNCPMERALPDRTRPILQPVCSVDLIVADDQGNSLKTTSVSQFTAGRSVSVDLNSDTDLTGKPRTQIHAYAVAPDGCNLTATLELIDNTSEKTVLVVGSKQTYPVERASPTGSTASEHR